MANSSVLFSTKNPPITDVKGIPEVLRLRAGEVTFTAKCLYSYLTYIMQPLDRKATTDPMGFVGISIGVLRKNLGNPCHDTLIKSFKTLIKLGFIGVEHDPYYPVRKLYFIFEHEGDAHKYHD